MTPFPKGGPGINPGRRQRSPTLKIVDLLKDIRAHPALPREGEGIIW